MNGKTRERRTPGITVRENDIAEQWRLAVLGDSHARDDLLRRIMRPTARRGVKQA